MQKKGTMKDIDIIKEIDQSKEIIAACLAGGDSVELAISRNGKLKAFRKRTHHIQLPGRKPAQEGGGNGK